MRKEHLIFNSMQNYSDYEVKRSYDKLCLGITISLGISLASVIDLTFIKPIWRLVDLCRCLKSTDTCELGSLPMGNPSRY